MLTTQKQVIGYSNISSYLQGALKLSISSQKPCQNQMASNYYSEMCFLF